MSAATAHPWMSRRCWRRRIRWLRQPRRHPKDHQGRFDRPALHKRSEEHTSELQSRVDLVCRLLLEKKKKKSNKEEQQKKDKDKNQKCAKNVTSRGRQSTFSKR